MKKKRESLAALRRAPILAALREAHFEGLVKVMEPATLKTGQILFRQGQAGEVMAVVTRGLLAVSLVDEKGTRTVLGSLGPGDVVGELAVMDPGARAATVTALKPSAVYCFSRKKLQGLRRKGPAVAMAMVGGILEQVAQRIRRTNEQIEARLRSLYGLTPAADRDACAAERPLRVTGAGELVNPRMAHGDVDLSRVPDLGALTVDDHRELRALAHEVIYPRGTVLCEENSWGESCYVIAEGKVDVFKAVDGKPRRLWTVGTCLLGQLALVDPAPRVATMRTATDVVVLELGRDRWHELMGRKSWFAVRFQDVVATACVRQLRRANIRLSALPQPPPAEAPFHTHVAPGTSIDAATAMKPPAPAAPASAKPDRGESATSDPASDRSPRDIVEDLLGIDGDAFAKTVRRRPEQEAPTPVTKRDAPAPRQRPRHRTMRLARVQTTLMFGVDPER